MLATIPVFIIIFYAVITGVSWGVHLSGIFMILILFTGYYKRLEFKNTNLVAFFLLNLFAEMHGFIKNDKPIYFFCMLLTMASYFFLYREALRYTKRETANKFILIFFIALIAANVYFLASHLYEIELRIKSFLEFAFYSLYYINILILCVVGLIYYLNSYSRKSVFFISLVMAVVFADVFRDMARFYLTDTSVQVMEYLLKYGAFILAFQFFATPEKKLRLINLI